MAGSGATSDPKYFENELFMLERTLGMYKTYASNAQSKADKKAWDERIHVIAERVEEMRKKLEKSQGK